MTALDRIMRIPEVLNVCGFGRTTHWQLVRAGMFPKSIDLGGRMRGVRESEVRAWIDARAAGLSDDAMRELVAQIEAARKQRAA